MGFETLRQVWREQAAAGEGWGASFSNVVLQVVAEEFGRGGSLDQLVEPWTKATLQQVTADAVPLRLLAGFHDLLLSGAAPALAAEYPGHGGDGRADPDRLRPLLQSTLASATDHLASFMASPPQTNEAGRSLCLFGGFLAVAAATGLPLRCLELGASAGLNQVWDRFRYDMGDGRVWGSANSPVLLDGAWTGGTPPLDAPVIVAERRACDQAPIDVSDPVAARRLVAYIWAEQTQRLQRVRAATALAQAAGVHVEAADAGEWAEIHASPRAGAATVLYHSIFWQYPPQSTRDRIRRAISAAGLRATREAPFAWLRMEPVSGDAPVNSYRIEVRLTLWPGGVERRLAEVHPHGAWVRWD